MKRIRPRPPPLTVEEIERNLASRGLLELVDRECARASVSRYQVLHRDCHLSEVVAVRHRLWALVRNSLASARPGADLVGYAELGRLFGRDHTTIRIGIEAHEGELDARYGSVA